MMWDWIIGGLLIVGSIVLIVCVAAAWALGGGSGRRGRDR